MKSKKTPAKGLRVPPQLIGIIDDAQRASIDTFALEYSMPTGCFVHRRLEMMRAIL
jgi:hypothetical protein